MGLGYYVNLGGKKDFVKREDLPTPQQELLERIKLCSDRSKDNIIGVGQWKYEKDTSNTVVKLQIRGDINVLEIDFLAILSQLPDLFPDLVDFYLDNNQITTIPNSFKNFSQLIRISLAGRNISSLPEDIFSHMPQLTHLSLHDMKLKQLPSSFYSLTQLKDFYWSNMPPFPTGSYEMKRIMPQLLQIRSDTFGEIKLNEQKAREKLRILHVRNVDKTIQKLKIKPASVSKLELSEVERYATCAQCQYLETFLSPDHELIQRLNAEHAISTSKDLQILK